MKFFFKLPDDYNELAEPTMGLSRNLTEMLNTQLGFFYLVLILVIISFLFKFILFFYHLFF